MTRNRSSARNRLITPADLIDALVRIEMLTATGHGLDPEATMGIHLMASIGRAALDQDERGQGDARQEVMF